MDRSSRSWKEVAVLLAIVLLPGLALWRVAQEVGLLGGLWGDAVTTGGRTAAGYEVVLTAYPPTTSP